MHITLTRLATLRWVGLARTSLAWAPHPPGLRGRSLEGVMHLLPVELLV